MKESGRGTTALTGRRVGGKTAEVEGENSLKKKDLAGRYSPTGVVGRGTGHKEKSRTYNKFKNPLGKGGQPRKLEGNRALRERPEKGDLGGHGRTSFRKESLTWPANWFISASLLCGQETRQGKGNQRLGKERKQQA